MSHWRLTRWSRQAGVGSCALWHLSGIRQGKCYSLLWFEVVLGIWQPSNHKTASRLLLPPLSPLFWKEIRSLRLFALMFLCWWNASSGFPHVFVSLTVMENMHSQRTNHRVCWRRRLATNLMKSCSVLVRLSILSSFPALSVRPKSMSPQGPLSSCSWAFDCFTQSSSADGVARNIQFYF